MIEFLQTYFLWIKAFHIVAVIAWMCGILYLPRLFVYHSTCQDDVKQSALFCRMEQRLLGFIMTPAAVLTWISGALLVAALSDLSNQGWLHAKLLSVVLMTLLHLIFTRFAFLFSTKRVQKTPRFFKILNEMPTILLIFIVIFVVVKPF